MTKVLIVDDSPVERQLAARLLEKHHDLIVLTAANGAEALDVIEREKPDAVLTDLNMPEMDGLQLVHHVRATHPLIPVVVMTAHGSEDVAVQALQGGAASYVPKKNLVRDLLETLDTVLEAAQSKRRHRRLMECLTRTESHFVLENDPALIPPLVGYLKDSLSVISGADETTLLRVSVALREAILNAMDHGNLELSSSLRETNCAEYHRLGDERRHQEPYRGRRVHVTARETPEESVYVISDEGPGFDPSKLPDPLDPENMENASGRGLLLIRTFMTEIRHNERGNEITMIRRAEPAVT